MRDERLQPLHVLVFIQQRHHPLVLWCRFIKILKAGIFLTSCFHRSFVSIFSALHFLIAISFLLIVLYNLCTVPKAPAPSFWTIQSPYFTGIWFADMINIRLASSKTTYEIYRILKLMQWLESDCCLLCDAWHRLRLAISSPVPCLHPLFLSLSIYRNHR